MAKFPIHGGSTIETATPDEIRQIVQTETAVLREQVRAWKVMDLPITLTGKVASSAITLGPSIGQLCGPESGYAWSIMALVVTGLTAGGTPDVVNIYKNDTSRPVWWQLNGNNFGVTFGKLQRVLFSGESLALSNSGSLAATGVISLSGTIIEVPGGELARLA